MGGDETLIAGLGCRRGCGAAEIVALVHRAEAACGARLTVLAAPAAKCAEPGLIAAASALNLPLRPISPASLAAAQPRCVTRSPAAARALGVASVAEGCALAAAGPAGWLKLPRIASAAATCAVAARAR
jgi:cobalt-precorrin 5A hydrolase